MRTLAFFIFLLSGASASGQAAKEEKPEKGSVQLEVGYFGDFLYRRQSASSMQLLSGKPLPAWALRSNQSMSLGSSSSINAGFYNLSFQRPTPNNGRVWWSAGLSFLVRTVAECAYHTDTVSLIRPNLAAGDTTATHQKRSWSGTSSIRGSQVNVPFGIRFVPVERVKRWIIWGFNLAPGVVFDHQFMQTVSAATLTPGDPSVALSEGAGSGHSLTIQKLPGAYFTGYAGIPVCFCFSPQKKFQFTASFETGYANTWMRHGITSGAFMMRLGVGVKYLI